MKIPAIVADSLQEFQEQFPDPNAVAFIMMPFGSGDPGSAEFPILRAIKHTLRDYDIVGLRADDHEYHSGLFENVLTYLYGCNIGIAVFDQPHPGYFNPNVSLELGYMMALERKKICILKDKTLQQPADLTGHLYKDYDPQNAEESIRQELAKWLTARHVGDLGKGLLIKLLIRRRHWFGNAPQILQWASEEPGYQGLIPLGIEGIQARLAQLREREKIGSMGPPDQPKYGWPTGRGIPTHLRDDV